MFYTEAELKQRLSISTYVFHHFQPVCEAALEKLATCGIRKIELLQSPEQFDMTNPASMKLVGEICRACGIKVAAYHAHLTDFNGLTTENERKKRVDTCRRQIDTMIELGGDVWSSHAGVADEKMIKSYQELARHVEGSKVHVAVENFGGELTVKARMDFLDKIDHPRVGMVLDIGHDRDPDGENPMCVPGGPSRVIHACAKRMCHVHLHGVKAGRDHFPPMTSGDAVQWIELFRALHATGYSGHMNFEPGPEHPDSLRAVADVSRRIGGRP